ncbi:MAG TPA: sulfite exporter TauE/SafE family protein [Pirellulales bacterium]|nr:sulfite exporter TauE/SafE family protein [Pirellulales bacterium]
MAVTVYVVIVVFFAMLVQSALGFGSGLVGLSLLVFRIPFEVAAPLIVLLSITVGSIIVMQDWYEVHLRSVSWLLVSSLFGMPLGLWLLVHSDPHLLKEALGLFLIGFSAYCLFVGSRLELKSDSSVWLCLCGFCAGVLGEAFGMSGPPLLIYGAMRRWSAQRFRATGQGFFLPSSAIILAGYWLTGLWVWTVTLYYLISLPAAIAALFLGRSVNRRLRGKAFHHYLYATIIGIGAVLLIQSLRR